MPVRPIDLYPDDRFPVKCWQVEWEFEKLLELYRERDPCFILEVGCYHGGTLYNWLHNGVSEKRVTVVDTFTAADNRTLFREWAWDVGGVVKMVEGDSTARATVESVSAIKPFHGFEWLHIDADHTYESVKSDFENYAPMVTLGGVVVLHDINPREGYGVHRLWREIQAAGYTTREIVADPNSGLCGIGVILDWPGELITE